ncbi:alkaline-phosphatase-like protein [Rhexocercosporidium sp. MPI-PUGE-AT-0058]|nr:alkaline-phosphatase-like protein [Rhexocercosporidium sp. MPI-PUGE-AT-0058]
MASKILPSVVTRTEEMIATLLSFIKAQGSSDYLGEKVSQLQHSLQASETVLRALLHDAGRFIPQSMKMPKMIAPSGTFIGRASHEGLREKYHTIWDLRYLKAFDEKYYNGLSQSGKQTLKLQGGIFTLEVKQAQKDPWQEQNLAIRRRDDLAKDPNLKSSYDGREYSLPQKLTAIICVDSFDPESLNQGIVDGIFQNRARFVESGFHMTTKSCMPSFTNPNNVSITTRAPPSFHRIAGNYYLDRKNKGTTLLSLLARRDVEVTAVMAKDRIHRILAHEIDGSIYFSAEKAGDAIIKDKGIEDVETWIGRPAPPQSSGDLSLYGKSDFQYLTFDEANSFMRNIDLRIGRLIDLGEIVAVTGDHAKVICPISDPFVRHHGVVGSFVRLCLESTDMLQAVLDFCKSILGVEEALPGHEAALRFEQPLDRRDEIVVISKKNFVISGLSQPAKKLWRNYDIFDLALNLD